MQNKKVVKDLANPSNIVHSRTNALLGPTRASIQHKRTTTY